MNILNKRQELFGKPSDLDRLHLLAEVVDIEPSDIEQSDDQLEPIQPELPPYINHAEGVNQIGKLTAAAVIRDFEETAKGFNAMGDEVKRVAECCERYLSELQALVEHTNQVAKLARERGSEIFRWLEQSALTTEQVRKDTDAMSTKLTNTVISAS